jgi:hypothetical protein
MVKTKLVTVYGELLIYYYLVLYENLCSFCRCSVEQLLEIFE